MSEREIQQTPNSTKDSWQRDDIQRIPGEMNRKKAGKRFCSEEIVAENDKKRHKTAQNDVKCAKEGDIGKKPVRFR